MCKKIIFSLCLLILFHCLSAFPIAVYDFKLPTSTASPVEAAMGGLNVTSAEDFFLVYSNPSLLRHLRKASFSMSFAIPPNSYDQLADVLKTPPFLKSNKLRGLAFQSKQVGLAYQVLAEENFTITDSLLYKKIYQDYKLNSYAMAFSDSVGKYNWGFTGKLLTGRLVYLSESYTSSADSVFIKEDFIDSKAFGYSFDLGINTRTGPFSYGLVVYDIYSTINWKGYKNGRIRTRAGVGLDYNSGNISLGAGMNSRWGMKDDPFYNANYAYKFPIGRPDSIQQGILRFGMVSKNFNDKDQVLFSFGLGYFYKLARLDLSLQSKGWKANETQYLFSFSLGE